MSSQRNTAKQELRLPFSYCKLSRAVDVLQCAEMDLINLAVENKIEMNMLLNRFYCRALFKGDFEQAEDWYGTLKFPTLAAFLSAQSRTITKHSIIEFTDDDYLSEDGGKTGADVFCENPQGEYISGLCFAHGLWRVNDVSSFQNASVVENFFSAFSPCLTGTESPIVQLLPGDLGKSMKELGPKAYLACTNTVSTDDLWVTKHDIERIADAEFDFDKLSFIGKVENPTTATKTESRKTIAKKGDMIEALLRLHPAFEGQDLDSIAPGRIKSIVEAIAAERGVSFPDTDIGTWSKYLRRGRHQQ
ncbi:MAG: hypothetical protein RSG77_25455 [Hafnia sp.]